MRNTARPSRDTNKRSSASAPPALGEKTSAGYLSSKAPLAFSMRVQRVGYRGDHCTTRPLVPNRRRGDHHQRRRPRGVRAHSTQAPRRRCGAGRIRSDRARRPRFAPRRLSTVKLGSPCSTPASLVGKYRVAPPRDDYGLYKSSGRDIRRNSPRLTPPMMFAGGAARPIIRTLLSICCYLVHAPRIA